METQRVVIIQHASREVSSSAMRWALKGLALKPGDMFTLLAVLHYIDTPSKSPYAGSQNLLGYKTKVNSNSMFGANERIVEREVARKKEEYEKNKEIIQISKLYELQKVQFWIEVAAGPSPKVVALKAAENLNATWVILDRQMKKDRKYFLEKLSCGISRMKRNNKIEQLRGPKAMKSGEASKQEKGSSLVTYDDMVPGIPEDLFSIEICPNVTTADQEHQIQDMTKSKSIEDIKEEWQPGETFQTSMCSLCKNRRLNIGLEMNFTYAELHAATDGFSARNSLSEGGIASTFQGQLKSNHLKIIVKQYKNVNPQGDINFQSEVKMLRKARHENILMLLGSCIEGSLKLLVYEYACNGSVAQHLSNHCPLPLTWTERMKVALGAARGLNYLHENNMVHRNVRTSTIVLTHDFEPRLGDFGLPSENMILETLEYLAPEYPGNWKLSTVTDVYAFGVVLLELVTGQKVIDKMPGGKTLVGWARPLLKERRLLDLIDPRIANSHDAEQLYWMGRVIQNCLNKVPNKRLTMEKVVSALECIKDRQSCHDVMEDLSAVRSFLTRRSSELIGIRSNEKTFAQESFSREIDVANRVSRSFSFTSSSAAATSTRTSTSFSRSSTSSVMSDKIHRKNVGSRVSLSYAEMLN